MTQKGETRKVFERLRMPVAALALVAGAAACTSTVEGTPTPQPASSSASRPKHLDYVMLTPDFSKLTKAGTCVGGDPRPCFLPIRKNTIITPQVTADDILNLINGVNEVQWPYEAHGASRGDQVKVVCQVVGETSVPNSEGATSDIWDVVEVPRDHMSARAIHAAEIAENPPYGVLKDETGNLIAVDGYAPAMWLPSTSPANDSSRLAPCNAAQNPTNLPTF
ncbi:MAG TPA: hypothetical protein VJR27_03345 [Candidatus Saccharimonadales bacterium]|nr:hypothetical protein [Candidatus Saccharimonadales bacterium]